MKNSLFLLSSSLLFAITAAAGIGGHSGGTSAPNSGRWHIFSKENTTTETICDAAGESGEVVCRKVTFPTRSTSDSERKPPQMCVYNPEAGEVPCRDSEL